MRWLKGITPEAVRAFRERRGWTQEQMADEVWASPLEVAAWEAGTVRVPREQARRMREIAARAHRLAAQLAQGPGRMPPCAWADAHAPGLHHLLWFEPGEVKSSGPVQRHLDECPTCQRVYELGRASRTNPAEPADPAEGLGRGLDASLTILRLALAAVAGAAVVTGLFLLQPEGSRPPDLWAAAVAGFVVFGIAKHVTPRSLRRRPYVSGLLAGVAGVLAGMLNWTVWNTEADLGNPRVLAVCAVLAVAAGLFDGWRRDGVEDDEDVERGAAEIAAAAAAPGFLPMERAPLDGHERDLVAPAELVHALGSEDPRSPFRVSGLKP